MAFTCPWCGRASRHPQDARQGYCAACNAFTRGTVHASAGAMFGALDGPGVPGGDAARGYQCESCGLRTEVPPEHAGRVWCPCGSARAMVPAPWVTASAVEFPDLAAAVRYIGEVYGQGVPVPEFGQATERIAEGVASYRNGLMSLAELRLEVSGHLDEATTDLITGSQRNPATDSGDYPRPAPGDGDGHWGDAMQWSPGDAEW